MWIRYTPLVVAAGIGATVVGITTHHASPPLLSSTDIGFAQDMSAHHQQAVTLADMISTDAATEVRTLGDGIRFQQLTEIGRMAGWLQLANAPAGSPHPMAWMHSQDHTADTDMGASADMTACGMASPADLTRLQQATGRANETLFLQLMTRHHQGGIEMASYAAQHTATDTVRRTALAMVDEQTQEIQLMAVMLNERGAMPLSYP